VGGGSGDEAGYSRESYEGGAGGRSERAAPASRPAASKPAPKSSTGFDDMDDDIPF
jgi:single-strand DNA-binding protein